MRRLKHMVRIRGLLHRISWLVFLCYRPSEMFVLLLLTSATLIPYREDCTVEKDRGQMEGSSHGMR